MLNCLLMTPQAISKTRLMASQVRLYTSRHAYMAILMHLYADGGDIEQRIDLNECVSRGDLDSLIAGLDQGEDTEETNFLGLTPL
jgi:hypothetical protein